MAEKAVEKFLRNLGRSKPERKPVRTHVVEVSAAGAGPYGSDAPEPPWHVRKQYGRGW